MKIVLVSIAAVLALAGCGTEAPAQNGDSIAEVIYTYNGASLHCVGYALDADGTANTNAALLSCDFVRYYAENPEKLNGPS